MAVSEALGGFFILFGVAFSVLGVIGVLRLPDTYSRLHATGKTGTLGIIGLCVGVAFLMPGATLKLIALVVFLVFSSPVASHVIAAGLHRSEQYFLHGDTDEPQDTTSTQQAATTAEKNAADEVSQIPGSR